jgi:MFS family permease
MEPRSDAGKDGKWMALLAAFFGWMFDGLEMGLFPLVAPSALRELMGGNANDQDISTWFSAIMAAFLVGAAFGGLIFGWLGDRIGRVRAMVWSVLTYSIFSGMCFLVQHPWQFGVLRFLASLGMGGEWALGVALVMEVWPSTTRPTMAGLIGAAANVGFLLMGLMGYAISKVIVELGDFLRAIHIPQQHVDWLLANSAWRMLLLLGATPAILTFFIRIFVPESGKWKHAASTSPKNRVRDIFVPGLARKTILGTLLAAVALLGTWGSVQWIAAWAGQISARDNQFRAMTATQTMPTTTGAAAAAPAPVQRPTKASDIKVSDITAKPDPTARALGQIWSAVGAIVFSILGAWAAQWTSRRWTYFALCALSLGVCAYLFRAEMHFDNYFLFLVFLAGGFTAAFYGWLPLYLPELFPTRVRATGQGFAFNAARVLAAAGTLGGGQLLMGFGGDYARMCSVISLVYVVGLVLIWFCPETKGKPLPE